MNTDPIADMLNRIWTAQTASKPMIDVPFSVLKGEIALCMEKGGFISKIIRKKKEGRKYLRLVLNYNEGGNLAITEIKRVSSPGQRIYKKSKEIKSIKGGRGVSIISTPQGVVTDKEARKKGLGGEVLCEIW